MFYAFNLCECNPHIGSFSAKDPSCEPSIVNFPNAGVEIDCCCFAKIRSFATLVAGAGVSNSILSSLKSFVSNCAYPVVKTGIFKVSSLVFCAFNTIIEDNLKTCNGSCECVRIPAVHTFNSSHSCAGPSTKYFCVSSVQGVPSVKIYVCPRCCVEVNCDFCGICGNDRFNRIFTFTCNYKTTCSSYCKCVCTAVNNFDVTIRSSLSEVGVTSNVRSVELNTVCPESICDLEAIACIKCKCDRSITVFVVCKSIFRVCFPNVHSTTNVPSSLTGSRATTGSNDFAFTVDDLNCEAICSNCVNDVVNTCQEEEVAAVVADPSSVCTCSCSVVKLKSCAVCTSLCESPVTVVSFCNFDRAFPCAVFVIVEHPFATFFEVRREFVECTCEEEHACYFRSIGGIKLFDKLPSNNVLGRIFRICCQSELVNAVLTVSKGDVPSSEVGVILVLRCFENYNAVAILNKSVISCLVEFSAFHSTDTDLT